MSPEELAGRVARLEANVAGIQAEVAKLGSVPIEQARMSERVASLEGTQRRLEEKMDRHFDELERLINSDKHDRQVEQQQRDHERKLDRRWLVGTVLMSTSIIVAALGLLLGAQ